MTSQNTLTCDLKPLINTSNRVHGVHVFKSDNTMPIGLDDGQYVVSRWNTNAYVTVTNSETSTLYRVTDLYGEPIKIGEEYLIIATAY
jgi:hypothetical protein